MTDSGHVREDAEAWLAVDPDPETRAELVSLIAAGGSELESRFGGRLAFGTAGLRGALGAGPLRMNRVLVRSTAAGLARQVLAAGGGRAVIGFDARHKSDVFALDTARVLAAMGIECHLTAFPVPTPVVAFGVRHLDAAAGVMVTASHNPRADNGFKVYWRDGAQIVPPIDVEIAAAIEAVGLVHENDLAPADDPSISTIGPELVDAYVEMAAAVVEPTTSRRLRSVYTPVHGVGRDVLLAVFDRAGFDRPSVVVEQGDPDPDFPTAAFPNPEEPGVLDLAVARATADDADIVLANDPDADRLAVAVRRDGAWSTLSGNDIGCLLADHLLSRGSGPGRMVVTTVVSSRLLAAIAAHHGVEYAETLTGFKWIVRPALERDDVEFVFGYEEALGYGVGDAVRDKDGITAALVFAELAAEARARGTGVGASLDELHRRHGVHLTDQRSFRFDGDDALGSMRELMVELRRRPPDELGGTAVRDVEDLLDPADGRVAADVLILATDEVRLVVRPSGTEPKLKLYGEAIVAVGADLDAARATARERLDRTLDAMSELIAGLG